MTDEAPFDASDMDGRLSECVVLADHRLACGLMHMDGAGLRVCTWDGTHLRHMSPAAARRLGAELECAGVAHVLQPVIEAVRRLADRVDEINAVVAANQAARELGDLDAWDAETAAFADMPVEGRA